MAHKLETPDKVKLREYNERTRGTPASRVTSYEIYSLRLAIESLSLNLGKRIALIGEVLSEGLAAIALAASTPEDNSAAVKEATARIKKQVELLKAARPSD